MPINALRITLMILLASCVLPPPAKTRPATPRSKTTTLRFVLTIAPGLAATPQSGRMLVVMDRQNGSDPVFRVGRTGLDAPPVLGRDVADLAPGKTAVLDHTAALFPLDDLAHLPVGDYTVQALLAVNRDLKSRRAPGNLYSAAQKVHLD